MMIHSGDFERILGGEGWVEMIDRPVLVPHDFLGMHLMGWPVPVKNQALLPKPSFRFGAVRTHDVGLHWCDIERTAGACDWARYDAFVTGAASCGARTVLFVLAGTPSFYAKDQRTDAYGRPGGASACMDVMAPARFISMMHEHHAEEFPDIALKVEAGNECNYAQRVQGGFWLGSLDDKLSETAVVFDLCVQLGIELLAPSVTGLMPPDKGLTPFEAFLKGIDPISKRRGADICHAVALHPYGHMSTPMYGRSSPRDPVFYDSLAYGDCGVMRARDVMRTMGIDKPVYITEWGVDAGVSVKLAKFNAAAPIVRRETLTGLLSSAAAMGVRGFFIYARGHAQLLSGDMVSNGAETDALGQFQNRVPGRFLTTHAYDSKGAIRALVNTGAALTAQGVQVR